MVYEAVKDTRRAQVRRQVKKMLKSMGKPAPNAAAARRAPAFASYEGLNRKVVIALQHLDKREETAWKKIAGEL